MLVANPAPFAGAFLDADDVPSLEELPHAGWGHPHPILAGLRFLGHPDDHQFPAALSKVTRRSAATCAGSPSSTSPRSAAACNTGTSAAAHAASNSGQSVES